MMNKIKALALGQTIVTKRITEALGNSETFDLACENDIVGAIIRLKSDKYDIALVDEGIPDLATTCYRIKSLHRIPLALVTRDTSTEWEKTRYLDIDGYIPLSSTSTDLFYHVEAIRILSHQRPDPIKSAISVLVVTPDPATQQSVRVAFRYYWPDSRVLIPGSGEVAVSLAIQQSPDVVLLDIRLPDLPSLAILKRLRTFCQAPVIMMMENQDEEVVLRAMNAGADDYMVKPIRKVELMARVRENLKRAMATF